MIKNLKFNQNSKFKIQNFRFKSFPKILTIFFVTVFVLQMICLFFLLTAPTASRADNTFLTPPGKFAPQVPIPGMEKEFGQATDGAYTLPGSTAAIAKYVKLIYNYGIGIIGILAAVVLMIGGVLWIVAGGNATQIGEAKAWIGAALTGLILALTSYLILSTINPALVNLQITKIPGVEKPPIETGSCTYNRTTGESTCENNNTKDTCDEKNGKFAKGERCPIRACCSYATSNGPTGVRVCTEANATEQDCRDVIKQLGGIFRSYLVDGRCPSTISDCVLR